MTSEKFEMLQDERDSFIEDLESARLELRQREIQPNNEALYPVEELKERIEFDKKEIKKLSNKIKRLEGR